MRKLLMNIALADRMRRLGALATLYGGTRDPKTIATMQLARFNAHWERAWREVPFYRSWRERHGLPESIASLADLHRFPALTKKALSDERDLVARSPGCERSTLTGGTSGISTAFPMSADDADAAWINTHLGRRWNGIGPHDRLYMIWGHSHLFSGKGAALKQLKRQLKDGLNNIRRVSAYNLNEPQLEQIARDIERFRPAYVIGYGSCLMRLCQHLRDRGRSLHRCGVRRVVNTSETLGAEDAPLVAAVFGCPVINEYGMAEAGVIGYSRGALYPIRVFWHDFIVATAQRRLMLTTLGARCFPLINYDTEDLCGDPTPASGSLLKLSSLMGKARDIFETRDVNGKPHEVSVILFDHILKQIDALRSLHYDLDADGTVYIRYTTDGTLLENAMLRERFVHGLRKEGIEIDPTRLEFAQISQPLQTVAGKRQTVAKRT